MTIANTVCERLKREGLYEIAKANVNMDQFVKEINQFEVELNDFLANCEDELKEKELELIVKYGIDNANFVLNPTLKDMKVDYVTLMDTYTKINILELIFDVSGIEVKTYCYFTYYEDYLYPKMFFSRNHKLHENDGASLGIEIIELGDNEKTVEEKMSEDIFFEGVFGDDDVQDMLEGWNVNLKEMFTMISDIEVSTNFYKKNELKEKGIKRIHGFLWDDVSVVLENDLQLHLRYENSLEKGRE